MSEHQDQSQFLTFFLNQNLYAMDVHSAREVVDMTAITPIPNTPAWVQGVINLRGSVIPVLDMKRALSMPASEVTRSSCIIIVEIDSEEEVLTVGVLADAVKEVFEMDQASIEAPPSMGGAISSECVRGIGYRNDDVFFILEVDRVFSTSQLSFAGAA